NPFYGFRLSRRLRLQPWRRQRLTDRFWIARNDGQVGARGLVWLDTALLPITQGANRDLIARREFFLAQPQGTPNDLRPRRALHPFHVLFGERAVVRITQRSGMLLRLGHRIEAAPIVFCGRFFSRFLHGTCVARVALPRAPK